MPTPFDATTVKDVEDVLAERLTTIHQSALLFAEGNHWQDGDGWMGPRLLDMTEGSDTALAEIRRGFVSKNVVKEITNRHISALIGREPRWEFALVRPLAEGEEPTADEAALIAEASAYMTTWWDERAVMKVLRRALRAVLCTDRGPLRLYVPAGLLDPNADDPYAGVVPPGDIPAQLSRLILDAPEPGTCTVLTDDETRRQAGVLLYERDQKKRVELSAVDGFDTVVRVLEGDTVLSEVRVPLGGRLLIAEMVRESLITEQVQSQQKVVNLALTMVPRNATMAGFMERVLTNAQLPGEWVDDPNAPDGKRFIAQPIAFGSGTVNNLIGIEIRDPETGEVKGYATPTISYKEPTPPATFEETKDLAYRCMLEECQQAHAAISGQVNVSADSRRQAMADFLMSLLLSAPELERIVRWTLETTLALAAHFAGQSGRYADLRAVVTAQIDTGPLTEADAQLAINLVGARLWSQQTGMAFVRVQDTDAEKAVIATEREADGTVGERLLSAFERG